MASILGMPKTNLKILILYIVSGIGVTAFLVSQGGQVCTLSLTSYCPSSNLDLMLAYMPISFLGMSALFVPGSVIYRLIETRYRDSEIHVKQLLALVTIFVMVPVALNIVSSYHKEQATKTALEENCKQTIETQLTIAEKAVEIPSICLEAK